MSKQRRYTREFKKEAVALAMDSSSLSSVAESLGVPKATLHNWVSIAKDDEEQEVKAPDGSITKVKVSDIMSENKSLKKRLARLEQEKAILKKAAQYFAAELK